MEIDARFDAIVRRDLSEALVNETQRCARLNLHVSEVRVRTTLPHVITKPWAEMHTPLGMQMWIERTISNRTMAPCRRGLHRSKKLFLPGELHSTNPDWYNYTVVFKKK